MKIVYQAYGRQDVLEQVYFSLVSLLAHRNADAEWSVLIYTDKPDFFADFQQTDIVELRTVTNEEIVHWAGPLNFVHRVKLLILKDAATRAKDVILYCDGDTVFLQDPGILRDLIAETNSVMHVNEYSFDRPNNPLASRRWACGLRRELGSWPAVHSDARYQAHVKPHWERSALKGQEKLRKFLKGKFWSLELEGNQFHLAIDYRFNMWNAGVIGLHHSHFNLIPQMISLSDQLHAAYSRHVMEQLAVSVVLQKITQVNPCDTVIRHYWNQKPEYLKLITEFRSKKRSLKSEISDFRELRLPEPPAPKKTFLQKIFSS